jgi:hypothetical protein
MVLGGKAAGPLAIPGSIVTTAGLILLFQGFAGGYYQSWAYTGALVFPAAVGVGLMIHGKYSDEPRLVRTGRRWLNTGLVIFLASGAFFEILIFRSAMGRIAWPALMIAFGAYLLMRRGGTQRAPAARIEVIDTSKQEIPTQPATPTRPIASPPPPAPTEFEPIAKPRARRKSTTGTPKV